MPAHSMSELSPLYEMKQRPSGGNRLEGRLLIQGMEEALIEPPPL